MTESSNTSDTAQLGSEPVALPNFFTNVDSWGAAEWFSRLADAVRYQDKAVVSGDEVALEICRNIISSSAMRLVRDYERQVRAALAWQQGGEKAAASAQETKGCDIEYMHQMIYRRVYNAVQHILGEQHLNGTVWLATQQAAEDIAASRSPAAVGSRRGPQHD